MDEGCLLLGHLFQLLQYFYLKDLKVPLLEGFAGY